MNKAIYLCAAAALAMASCSNDELVEVAKNDTINFRTVVGLNTKGAETTTANFNTKELWVTTFLPGSNAAKLFNEKQYKLVDGSWTGHQYWGDNASLTFYLTSPGLKDWAAADALTATSKDIEGVMVKDKINDQIDYVYAETTIAKPTSTTPSTVTLKHAMSQIQIKAKNSGSYKYEVKGIRISNVNSKGNFNLSTGTWSSLNDVKKYEVVYDSPRELTSDAQDIMVAKSVSTEDNAMLIPQTTTPWITTTKDAAATGSYISVLVNITTDAGAAVYPKGSTASAKTYGWVAVPVTFNWTSGNKYIYTLDFTKGAGRVDPVDPGTDVKPGETGKDPDKGEPVLGNDMIKFTVTVDTWTTQNQSDTDMKS